MNLFVAKKGEFAANARDLVSAIQGDAMFDCFREGHLTERWDSPCSSISFASVREGPERAKPREYLHSDAGTLVTFDGLPIDSLQRFHAHDATQIAKHWSELDADIDGFYCALRIDKDDCSLEVQTDVFGVYKIYSWTDGRSCLVSNSISALDSLVNGLGYDMAATSMFLSMAWVPGSHSLLEGVRSLGPGERLTWDRDSATPRTRQTVKPRELFQHPAKHVDDGLIDDLSQKLVRTCQELGEHFPNVLCPLTGGKDSRLLAVLLRAAGVPARAYTYGNALGTDAKIAARVAAKLGVDHESILTSTAELFSDWDDLSHGFVARGEGLCPLQLITGSLTAALVDETSKPVRLWGAGSSICRAPFFNPADYLRNTGLSAVKKGLTWRLARDHRGLIKPEAVAVGRDYVGKELDRYFGDGVRALDLPDVFWAYERGSARSGKNMRSTMHRRDTYSPFFGKAFAAASFSLSSMQRATEPLHYSLLKTLAPELQDVPFDKGGWKTQNRYLNLLNELNDVLRFRAKVFIDNRRRNARSRQPRHMLAKDTMFERVKWLRLLVNDMREQLSDSSNADLWDVVDRDTFERVTSASATDSELAQNIVPLFTLGTVLTYRRVRKGRVNHAS